MPDWKAAASLVRKIAENYRLPYYTISPTYSICPKHGYHNGEVTECPKCGLPMEVYSRITGYYRSVANWNDAKTKEFDMRRPYVAGEGKKDKEKDVTYLFGTKTCPNCKVAKDLLTKAKVKYEYIDAEETPELAKKYGVTGAPTLVVVKKGQASPFHSVPNIKKYITEV